MGILRFEQRLTGVGGSYRVLKEIGGKLTETHMFPEAQFIGFQGAVTFLQAVGAFGNVFFKFNNFFFCA